MKPTQVACLLAGLCFSLALWGGTPRRSAHPKPKARHRKVAPAAPGKGRNRHRKAVAAPSPRHGSKPIPLAPPAPAPIRDPQVLAPFFRDLEEVRREGRTVRILHFGDSHTAADFWTGRIRAQLQARYGDGGPGLILPGRPWRGYHHDGVDLQEGLHWPADSLRSRTCEGWVGLTGASLQAPAPDSLFRLQSACPEARVQLLGAGAPQGEGLAPERLASMEVEGRLLQVFQVKAAADGTLAFGIPPGTALLGVDLRSGHPGVIYDELGLNGAELLDQEKARPELRKALLQELHPDLVVLAYGTNDLGRTDLDPADYRQRVQKILTEFRQESGAPVLVIGPLDRVGRQRRQVARLRVAGGQVIQALREAAHASGCAFWDARAAMGGPGTLVRWRRQGLAQRDLVHLTGPGYQKLGDLLLEALRAAQAADR
nr:GDSL-type esterase/lipase family protein [uncultured Holophaga sp.]